MTRLPDWEERLGAYIASVRDRPHVWGEHDCILHGASAAEAQTGVDIAEAYRGKYADRKSAAAILKAQGKGTLLRTLNATLSKRRPAMARRGDLVWFEGSVGVCLGREAAFVGEELLAESAGVAMREGLVMIPRRLWSKAWAV